MIISRRRALRLASLTAVEAVLHETRMSGASPRLLLVHGRGQAGRDQNVIRAEWLKALRAGLPLEDRAAIDTFDVSFPYYGDVLETFAKNSRISLVSEIQARGSALEDEFLVFQAEFAEAIRVRAGVTDEQVDAEYGADPQPRGPLNWRWVQATLRAIDKHSPGTGQRTLEAFTRDVFLYCTRPGVRDEVDAIVGAALTDQPTVIVAHSLGSVVAYSVLRTDRRNLQVPLFVTVGSPLGVRSVRDHFRPLRFPRVGSWYNAFDQRDVVALYPLDEKTFPVQPAIANNGLVRNGTDNRHGIAGYLGDSDVAMRILDALRAQ